MSKKRHAGHQMYICLPMLELLVENLMESEYGSLRASVFAELSDRHIRGGRSGLRNGVRISDV